MRGPSMFSREYKRKMRERRRRRAFLTIIVILGTGIFFFGDGIKNWFTENMKAIGIKDTDMKRLAADKEKDSSAGSTVAQNEQKEKQGSQTEQNSTPDGQEKVQEVQGDQKDTEVKEETEKFYEMKMPEGQTVKVAYEEKGQERSFKYAQGENEPYFNISPSQKSILVMDNKNQDMFVMNNSGGIADITRKEYINSKGTVTYPKSTQLKRVPDYLWHGTPKFIDEENIVYISNLPWFDKKGKKYIWIYNLNNKKHINIYYKGAFSISFDKYTEKGLLINIDGKARYIVPGGKIVE